MGETVFQKGPATGDEYKNVLFARRRFGGIELGVVNTGEANGLTYKVEAAAGPEGTTEVPDWSVVAVVATDANVAGDAIAVADIAEASAVHTHYRVAVRSQATGAATPYLVYGEDEKA